MRNQIAPASSGGGGPGPEHGGGSGVRRLSAQYQNYDRRESRRMSIAESIEGADNPNVLSKADREKHVRHSTAVQLKAQLRQSYFEAISRASTTALAAQQGHGGQTTTVAVTEELPPSLDLLRSLRLLEHVFIVPATAAFPIAGLTNKFELVDSTGHRLFFMAELLGDDSDDGWSHHREVDILVLGTGKDGGFLCNVSGTTKYAIVEDPRQVTHGTVEADGHGRGHVANAIHAESGGGGQQFQFVPASERPRDSHAYKILGPGGTEVGEVKADWNLHNPKTSSLQHLDSCYGIRFLSRLDPESKMVLLAAFLVLFFLNKVHSEKSSKKKLWVGVAYSAVVGLLVLGMAITVIYCAMQPRKL